MEEILLRDPKIFPTNEVLENALGDNYAVFTEFIHKITDTGLGLFPEWRYYKDGKSWLCKTGFKKKTICWLSIWDNYFKLGFYFTEKNGMGIAGLNIDEQIKEEFSQGKPIGKLYPLSVKMHRKEQIEDVIKIIEYKKNLK